MSSEEWINRWKERAKETGRIESPDSKIMIDGGRNIR